jgi:hypothetical protein
MKNPQQIEIDFHMNQLDDAPILYTLACPYCFLKSQPVGNEGNIKTRATSPSTSDVPRAKEGNIAPQRKLADEKPKGETVDYDTLIKSWPASPPKRASN